MPKHRPRLVVVLGFAMLMALTLAISSGSAQSSNSPIAATALNYLGTHGGQCKTFVQRVVAEATGRYIGADYRLGYFQAGAVEVSPDEAMNGDIIQIADDNNSGPMVSYDGLHTAIILDNLGGGTFNAVDSNQNWDEMVRLRPNYNPYASAAKHGLDVHIYRIPGNSAVETAKPDSRTWAAGAQGSVQADGACLNLRSGPGLASGIVTCLPGGTTVHVTGDPVESNGYTWLPVDTPSGSGWVASAYLDQTAVAAIPASLTKPAEDGPSVTRTVSVDSENDCLRLRSGPGLSNDILTCLGQGTTVTLVDASSTSEDGYTWVPVTDGSANGWVAAEYLTE